MRNTRRPPKSAMRFEIETKGFRTRSLNLIYPQHPFGLACECREADRREWCWVAVMPLIYGGCLQPCAVYNVSAN